MHHTLQLEHVREIVEAAFRQIGIAEDASVTERILIQDGFYCGRRFLCDGLQATWFAEEKQLKIFGRDGSLIEVQNGNDREQRRAA